MRPGRSSGGSVGAGGSGGGEFVDVAGHGDRQGGVLLEAGELTFQSGPLSLDLGALVRVDVQAGGVEVVEPHPVSMVGGPLTHEVAALGQQLAEDAGQHRTLRGDGHTCFYAGAASVSAQDRISATYAWPLARCSAAAKRVRAFAFSASGSWQLTAA